MTKCERWIDQQDMKVDKEKRDRALDLPNTGRTLYPLSYENSWRARLFNLITELEIHHLYSLVTTHNDSMSSRICSSVDRAQFVWSVCVGLHVVMGLIPARDLDFFFVQYLHDVDQSPFFQ